MVKSDLREQGFSSILSNPQQSRINAIWITLTLFLIVGTFSVVLSVTEIIDEPNDNIITLITENFGVLSVIIFLIGLLLLYLCLKLFMTILFCHQPKSIKMKILEHKGIPICLCREALKVWQTVLIYLLPVVLMYALTIFMCVYCDYILLLSFFFLLFYIAFDLTLIIYVLFIKIREKIDYISIDHHVYEMTLFKKSYVKFKRKTTSRFLISESEKNIANGKFNWKH